MGSKDKRGRSAKKAPARSLKEKRLHKKSKKTSATPSTTVEKAFDR